MIVHSVNADNLVILESFENPATVLVFRINTLNGKLSKLQIIFLKQNNVEHYVIDGNLYLIACTTQSFCAVYKWTNLQFRRHRKLSAQVFEKVKSIYSRHDLVVVEDSLDNLLKIHSREEDVLTTDAGLAVPNDFNEFLFYKSEPSRKVFFVDAKFTEKELLINFREILKMENNFESRSAAPENPAISIVELKEQLRQRIVNVGKSKTMVSLISRWNLTTIHNLNLCFRLNR